MRRRKNTRGCQRCNRSIPNWRSTMTRLAIAALAALTLVASPALLAITSTPVVAQEDDWDGGDSSLRDLVQSWVQDRGDRHDMLTDLIQERRDRRDLATDMMRERMDRRDELADILRNHPGLRDRLRDRLASQQDDGDGGSLRDRLRDRLASRQDDGDGAPRDRLR